MSKHTPDVNSLAFKLGQAENGEEHALRMVDDLVGELKSLKGYFRYMPRDKVERIEALISKIAKAQGQPCPE